MRTISAPSLAKLEQNLGTEPLNTIEIQWIAGGNRIPYGDKSEILELSGLDTVIQVSGGSDSNEIHIVLDDTDSEIKNLIDNHDANKRPVWVYQWFQGLADSEKFLIFRGEISSPLVWDEGGRTVSFTVISKIEDAEVGFSIEEGNFPQPPDDLIGKPWPLVFGTVCDIKALKTGSPRQGILKSGVGIHDFTLENRICQAGFLSCPAVLLGNNFSFEQANGQGWTDFVPGNTPILGGEPVYGPEPDCVKNRCDTVARLEFELAQQLPHELSTITVIGGGKFPQTPTIITLNINGGKFTGSFAGEVFTIISRKHPEFDTTTLIDCADVGDSAVKLISGAFEPWQRSGTTNTFKPFQGTTGCAEGDPVFEETGGASASQAALDAMPTSNFFWASSGSRVTMEGEEEILYIANLLPSTINRVSAFRRLTTGDTLMTLPEDMYEIFQTDYNGYIVTELLFNTPPSLVPNPVNGKIDGKWDDDVYVSMTSSVGPNTVDILQYLIETYTSFEIDGPSFMSVKVKVENYPSNFAILDRKNVVEVLREVAEQARIALYIRDNTVYLKYLSEEPTSVATIAESDILANSLEVTHTPTEDLVTKYTATWKKSGAQAKDDTIILRHNIKKYGTQEDETDYYTYNIRENVLKSATFWLIRKSISWRRVVFKTTIKHLALEIFDCVTLDLPDVAPDPVKAIIEKATFDSKERTIDFECWTPLISGTTVPYAFAWPAGLPATTEYPPQDEIDAGFAGSGGGDGYIMIPPVGHLLSHQTEPADNRADWGDRFPSDLDDSFITISCPVGADVDLEDEEAPILAAFERGATAGKQALNATQSMGGAGGGGKSKKKDPSSGGCGAGSTNSCIYGVNVYSSSVALIRDANGTPQGQGCGTFINVVGGDTPRCEVFGSLFAARGYVKAIQAEIKAMHESQVCVGNSVTYNVNLGGSSGGPQCAQEELDQGDTPDPTRDVKLTDSPVDANGAPTL